MTHQRLCEVFEFSEENETQLDELLTCLASQSNVSVGGNAYLSLFFPVLPESPSDPDTNQITESNTINADSRQLFMSQNREICGKRNQELQYSFAQDNQDNVPKSKDHDCDTDLSTLTKEFKDCTESLKCSLHNGNINLQDVEFLSKVHPTQMKEITGLLNLQSIAEDSFFSLCERLSELGLDFSHSSCMIFLNESLLPRLLNATNSSRIMKETVAVLANKFPRAILDIFIMICTAEHFNVLQHDIVVDVIKRHFQDPHQELFIRELIHIDKDWDEMLISVLQSIMEIKISIKEEIMDVLIGKMLKANTVFNSNMKFSKLLYAIIRYYGQQVRNDKYIEEL